MYPSQFSLFSVRFVRICQDSHLIRYSVPEKRMITEFILTSAEGKKFQTDIRRQEKSVEGREQLRP